MPRTYSPELALSGLSPEAKQRRISVLQECAASIPGGPLDESGINEVFDRFLGVYIMVQLHHGLEVGTERAHHRDDRFFWEICIDADLDLFDREFPAPDQDFWDKFSRDKCYRNLKHGYRSQVAQMARRIRADAGDCYAEPDSLVGRPAEGQDRDDETPRDGDARSMSPSARSDESVTLGRDDDDDQDGDYSSNDERKSDSSESSRTSSPLRLFNTEQQESDDEEWDHRSAGFSSVEPPSPSLSVQEHPGLSAATCPEALSPPSSPVSHYTRNALSVSGATESSHGSPGQSETDNNVSATPDPEFSRVKRKLNELLEELMSEDNLTLDAAGRSWLSPKSTTDDEHRRRDVFGYDSDPVPFKLQRSAAPSVEPTHDRSSTGSQGQAKRRKIGSGVSFPDLSVPSQAAPRSADSLDSDTEISQCRPVENRSTTLFHPATTNKNNTSTSDTDDDSLESSPRETGAGPITATNTTGTSTSPQPPTDTDTAIPPHPSHHLLSAHTANTFPGVTHIPLDPPTDPTTGVPIMGKTRYTERVVVDGGRRGNSGVFSGVMRPDEAPGFVYDVGHAYKVDRDARQIIWTMVLPKDKVAKMMAKLAEVWYDEDE